MLDLSAALRPVPYEPGGVALNEIGVSLALALVAAVLEGALQFPGATSRATANGTGSCASPRTSRLGRRRGAGRASRSLPFGVDGGERRGGRRVDSYEAAGAARRRAAARAYPPCAPTAARRSRRAAWPRGKHALEPFAAIDLQPMLKLEQLVATLEALPLKGARAACAQYRAPRVM